MADEVFAAIAHERLPAAADRRADAVRGAVVALEVDRSPNLDWIASQLAMILRGASPADIPVLSPRRLILMVNLDASRALRLSVPRAVLRQADAIVSDGKY
jgi:putative ABC transport system substrate-binding protein